MRVLDARQVAYDVFAYPESIQSAEDVADYLAVSRDAVLKTLVALRTPGAPFLVMLPASAQLDTKRAAGALGAKRVKMASHREAERLTGLQVGGISPLALLGRSYAVFIDEVALQRSHVLVSAGQRGVNLRVAVPDLVEVTGARAIRAAR